MDIQTIKIDVVAYLYDDCIKQLDTFYIKLKDALRENLKYRDLEIEKLPDGIHLFSEIENEIEFEIDDEYCFEGSGHWNGVIRQSDFFYYLRKFIKGIDSEHLVCELDDNSNFNEDFI